MPESSEADPARAWRAFCERIAALADDLPGGDPAEAIRHLARHVSLALEEQLDHADPRHPILQRYEEPWRQWGAPNPDNVYHRTAIDPGATYRVWADVTGVRELLVSLVEGDMHLGEFGVFAERSLAELEVGDDGGLELWISPEAQPGNWLATDPKARIFMVRQYQVDWAKDAIARFQIERVDTRGEPPAAPTGEEVAAALARTATWVERSLHFWASAFSRADAEPNVIGPPRTPPGGAPHIGYGAGRWSLAPGEALLVTSEVPDADYWGYAAHSDHLFDTGDFASRQTSLNHLQLHRDGDGRVRIVLAHTDPGTPNWIDTSGRPGGLLTHRMIGARTRPAPSARVVRLESLRAALPDDHPVVDASTRRELLARRRTAVLARYA